MVILCKKWRGQLSHRGASLLLIVFFLVAAAALLPLSATTAQAASAEGKTLIYDDAGLLNQTELDELQAMAAKYGEKRKTDFLIVTTRNEQDADVQLMTEDFYDEHAPGYDKPHGNAVILMVDMNNREVYLAGFYKGEEYLDEGRLDKIRNKMTPAMTSGDYAGAFKTYVKTAYRYMGVRPGVNPDNILFKLWFQIVVALALAWIVVGVMAFRSGGRVTVHRKTYEESGSSGVLRQRDQFLHTTVTKQKIQTNSGGGGRGGGGGGGGRTGGGHSHSGSRGSF